MTVRHYHAFASRTDQLEGRGHVEVEAPRLPQERPGFERLMDAAQALVAHGKRLVACRRGHGREEAQALRREA